MVREIELTGYGRHKCPKTKERTRLIPNSNMIHFIEAGSGYFNGRLLSKGQGFVCRKNILCDYIPNKDDPWTYSWINVIGDGASELIDRLPLDGDVFELPPNTDAFERICAAEEGTAKDEVRVLGILFEIFSKLFADDGKPRDYVSLAVKHFKNDMDKGVTVQQVADRLNISRAYLRNIFFEKMGVSPKNYLMALKMQRAEFLLKTPYSITEIAQAVGYTDVLQFSRIFSKYHGISPSQYKKENFNEV